MEWEDRLEELRNLLNKTTFDLDIVELSDYGQRGVKLVTSKCQNGLFLEVSMECGVYTFVVVRLCYGDDSYTMADGIWKENKGAIKQVSDIISGTCAVGNIIGSEISKLETNIMLASSVDWVEIFKNGLINIFKDFDVDGTETLVVHLIGVDFIVKFNENTKAFSVEVAQTTQPDNSKALLVGVVCDNNYNNVLSAIRKEFNSAKSRFYHLESLSNMII
jgi:hypothetical protein